jgi:hypothetical protein
MTGNPYAETPLWARWYSECMGWPVTQGVLNAADGPVRCDSCGADRDADGTLLSLDSSPTSYCFGCGAITCSRCVPDGIGPHKQSAHARVSA